MKENVWTSFWKRKHIRIATFLHTFVLTSSSELLGRILRGVLGRIITATRLDDDLSSLMSESPLNDFWWGGTSWINRWEKKAKCPNSLIPASLMWISSVFLSFSLNIAVLWTNQTFEEVVEGFDDNFRTFYRGKCSAGCTQFDSAAVFVV